jgi:hypothetical protein
MKLLAATFHNAAQPFSAKLAHAIRLRNASHSAA